MYIKRSIEQTITKLSEEFPVIVITGARQVGKSTMLRMIKDEGMNYVSLDDMDVRNLALSDPKYFLEQYSYPLLIDEIQYAPDLLPYIKMIVDEERLKSLKNNKPTRALFWLTGSQQFNVMKNISESLAGRVGVLSLYSLSLSEITHNASSVFSPNIDELKKKDVTTMLDTKQIFERIYSGGMPSVVTENVDRNDYFSSYVTTYI